MSTTDDLLQEASILRSWGLPVFPVARKLPRCRWKHFQHRTPSDRELARLFRLDGVDGIAAVPGARNDFGCRDFDKPDAYHQWAESHPDLARVAPTVRTGRAFHVWHRTRVRLYRELGDGEYRGDGRHYVVVPPSRHPKTRSLYEWLTGPPLGRSCFPLVDPYEAGFVEAGKQSTVDISHLGVPPAYPAGYSGSSPRLLCDSTDLPEPILEAIYKTQPRRLGERNQRVHRLARALRDHVADDAPPTLLYDVVLQWWKLAVPVIGTKDFGETLTDFRRAWAAESLVSMSDSRPKRAMAKGASKGGSFQERLLGLCRELAAETGGSFYLSVRTAAAVLGVSKTWADRLLKALVASEHLEVVVPGRPSIRGRMGTTWYRLPQNHSDSQARVSVDLRESAPSFILNSTPHRDRRRSCSPSTDKHC